MSRSDYTEHQCSFNTAGYCPTCGARVALPKPSTTAPDVSMPGILAPIENVREFYMGEKGRDLINGGSPVGPGFVVFERAPGEYGYSVKMARGSVGPGWRPLVQALFDHVEHDKKWNPKSGFANLVVTQVKEKFGDLRIYFHTTGTGQGGYDRVDGFIDALTSMSQRICEACGAPGSKRDRSWVLTLCDACDKKDRTELRNLFEQTEQSE